MKSNKWNTKLLGEVVTTATKKYNPITSRISLPCIELEHLAQGTGRILGCVPSLELGSLKNHFEPNDVIFGKLRPYLKKYAMPSFEGVCSTEIWVLTPSEDMIKPFLYQFVQSDEFIAEANKSFGTKMPRADWQIISKMPISLPPLPQQQKISKVLSTCDTVINQTGQAIEKYQAVKQGMIMDLFNRGIDVNTGKLIPSYEEQPDLYKESESGWIPRDWNVAKLEDYTIKNMYGPRFSANDYNTNGNVRTIRGMDFSKDGNILYKQAPIASLPVSKVSTHLLVEDDVVIVTTADCGLTAVYEEQGFPYIPSAYSVKFRFAEDLNPYFFKYFMQTNFAHRLVSKYVRQGTLGNLPGSDILIFEIIVPNFDEQKLIVEKLDFIGYKIQTEKDTLKKYQQIKAGLMQDLLTGKVKVQTDDVA